MKVIPMKLNLKKASEVLQAARKIIRDPRHWTTNLFAQDSNGDLCKTRSENAVAFCALGAIQRINGPKQAAATVYLREAGKKLRGHKYRPTNDDIFTINDGEGHEETLKMFSFAIRAAKRDGN